MTLRRLDKTMNLTSDNSTITGVDLVPRRQLLTLGTKTSIQGQTFRGFVSRQRVEESQGSRSECL